MGFAIDVDNNILTLVAPFGYSTEIKAIQGYKWNPKLKRWEFPLSKFEELVGAECFRDQIVVSTRASDAHKRWKDKVRDVQVVKNIAWQDAVPLEPMPIKNATPFQHQVAGYNLAYTVFGLRSDMEESGGVSYFMEMGAGKTLTAIAVAARGHLNGKINKVLVICPNIVLGNWRDEFQMFSDVWPEVIVLDGSKSTDKRAEMLQKWDAENQGKFRVAIINYEGARVIVSKENKQPKQHLKRGFARWSPDLLICDEAHKLKTPGSQQSMALASLARKIPFRLALTGTPINNSPLDLYGIFRMVDPGVFGTSFLAFRNRYAIMGGFGGKQVIGYQNQDELIQKSSAIAFRITKRECLDLPPVTNVIRKIRFEPGAMALYRTFEKQRIVELANENFVKGNNVLTKILRMTQMTGGWVRDDTGKDVKVSDAKLHGLGEVLDEVGDKKVVIFARFLKEMDGIEELLRGRGLCRFADKGSSVPHSSRTISRSDYYSSIRGDVKQNTRDEMVRAFQDDPNCKVFLGQIDTIGLGINLVEADTSIFYSFGYSYAVLDQARSRLDRVGQKNPVTNIFLVNEGTIDEVIFNALEGKQDLAEAVVDTWRKEYQEMKKTTGGKVSIK